MSQQDDFERWAKARGRISLCKRPDGSYAFATARAAWDAWQHLTALSVPALRRRTRIHYNGEEIGTMEHRT